MEINMTSGTVMINGQSFSGKTVTVRDGRVFVDGNPQDMCLQGRILVHVYGNCQSVDSGAGDVSVSGSVLGNVTTSAGDIQCGRVGGNVSTKAGDVTCGPVAGTVRTVTGDIQSQ